MRTKPLDQAMGLRIRNPFLALSPRRAARTGWRFVRERAHSGLHILSRLRASPHEVALGCAVGAFVSITPLIGAQTLMAILFAAVLRASVPAAVLGTFVGNPLSWPFIWASTYAMGLKIIGFEGVLDADAFGRGMLQLWGALIEQSPQVLDATAALLRPLLLPMLAGSLPIGLFTAAIVYYGTRHLVQVWRARQAADAATAAAAAATEAPRSL